MFSKSVIQREIMRVHIQPQLPELGPQPRIRNRILIPFHFIRQLGIENFRILILMKLRLHQAWQQGVFRKISFGVEGRVREGAEPRHAADVQQHADFRVVPEEGLRQLAVAGGGIGQEPHFVV